MSDVPPPLVAETSRHGPPPPTPQHDFSSSCPFCIIANTYQPISPLSTEGNPALDSEKVDPPSFVLFSSEHVVAFFDIMPLTRGHVLVAPRKHREKLGDLSPDESAEIGRVLPLLARSVMKAVLPDIPHEEVDYNVVQNNGPGAAQVVPHVHFHIVPRPPLNYVPPDPTTSKTTGNPRKYARNAVPSGIKRSMIVLGRGMRTDLDYDEAGVLVEEMRRCVQEEWRATFGAAQGTEGGVKRPAAGEWDGAGAGAGASEGSWVSAGTGDRRRRKGASKV